MKGLLIVIDGVDGSGKTTVCKELYNKLNKKMNAKLIDIYYDQVGVDIFKIIKHTKLTPEVETLLFSAIFQRNWDTYIKDWLRSGDIVVADRWITTTYAYQVECLHSDINPITTMNAPDIKIFLDIDKKVADSRISERRDKWESNKLIKDNLDHVMRNMALINNYNIIDTNNKSINDIVDEAYDIINNYKQRKGI